MRSGSTQSTGMPSTTVANTTPRRSRTYSGLYNAPSSAARRSWFRASPTRLSVFHRAMEGTSVSASGISPRRILLYPAAVIHRPVGSFNCPRWPFGPMGTGKRTGPKSLSRQRAVRFGARNAEGNQIEFADDASSAARPSKCNGTGKSHSPFRTRNGPWNCNWPRSSKPLPRMECRFSAQDSFPLHPWPRAMPREASRQPSEQREGIGCGRPLDRTLPGCRDGHHGRTRRQSGSAGQFECSRPHLP